MSETCDVLIVGSGAGGATLARELAKRGCRVLVVERGVRERCVGSFRNALRYYDGNPLSRLPAKSREGVTVYRALMAGGSTAVSCGSGVPCLERELRACGVDIASEIAEAQADLRVSPLPPQKLSARSRQIASAAHELGYSMEPMPKSIDSAICLSCGNCVFGCAPDAKWTGIRYLDEARGLGAEVVFGTRVHEVIAIGGRASGIRAVGPQGPVELHARAVVLAAGGLGTPVILQRSGLAAAGEGLFVDLFVSVYASLDFARPGLDPAMSLVDREFHADKGFILSTFVNGSPGARFVEAGARGAALQTDRMVGLMTKIADEEKGRVFPDGTFSKSVSARDEQRLNEGIRISKQVLIRAGANPRSITSTRPAGAHPGGTAAIGRVVDSNLQTSIEGLFVCDCSVLPAAPGLPPILTIVALAKRLAKAIA